MQALFVIAPLADLKDRRLAESRDPGNLDSQTSLGNEFSYLLQDPGCYKPP